MGPFDDDAAHQGAHTDVLLGGVGLKLLVDARREIETHDVATSGHLVQPDC